MSFSIANATNTISLNHFRDNQQNIVDTTTISGLGGTGKWQGCVLAPNGNIYSIPYDNTSVLVIKTGLPKHPSWMLKPYFDKF